MKNVTLTELREVLKTGRFFTVVFIKKDNTVRTMNCRTGVKAGLKPTTRPRTKPEPENVLTVWDVAKQAYRRINLNQIVFLNVDGKRFYLGNRKMIESLSYSEREKLWL